MTTLGNIFNMSIYAELYIMLCGVWITWCVKNRDTDASVRVNVRVVHLTSELHFGWRQRIVRREGEFRWENAALKAGTLRPRNHCFPFKEIILVNGTCNRKNVQNTLSAQCKYSHQPKKKKRETYGHNKVLK